MDDINQNADLISKYKKHRNVIVKVYYEHYWPNKEYMSASKVRKYICDDAYWLMKIHIFLTNCGVINQTNINHHNESFNAFEILAK